MVLADKLRQVLVFEEFDDFEAYDKIHEDQYQKEFIFKLFQVMVLGGGMC